MGRHGKVLNESVSQWDEGMSHTKGKFVPPHYHTAFVARPSTTQTGKKPYASKKKNGLAVITS
jgi:hypothetical protein